MTDTVARHRLGRPLRILCDVDIPFATAAFGRYGVVRVLPGRLIDQAACARADVLIIRSVTRVDAALLDGSPPYCCWQCSVGRD